MQVAFLFLFFSLSVSAQASEKIGTFSIEALYLRPTFTSNEVEGGEFGLSESQFALKWSRDKNISAYVSIGSELERNLPVYYQTVPEDKIGFVEAYASYQGVYGEVRAGLVPIGFGYDGVVKSHERYFNRAQIYSERIIGLTDMGVSFWTSHNGYYTQLTVHNGEIDTPSDGRVWTSGHWGYTNDRNMRVQLSMQSGFVKSAVSTGSNNTIAGVVNSETTKWRNGAFFINWYPRNWNVVAQFAAGEAIQDGNKGRYSSEMAEVSHFFSKNFGVGFRYDALDPDGDLTGDRQTDTSLLLVAKTDDSTSAVFLLATKSVEQSLEVPNDQLRLVWLLTPFAR